MRSWEENFLAKTVADLHDLRECLVSVGELERPIKYEVDEVLGWLAFLIDELAFLQAEDVRSLNNVFEAVLRHALEKRVVQSHFVQNQLSLWVFRCLVELEFIDKHVDLIRDEPQIRLRDSSQHWKLGFSLTVLVRNATLAFGRLPISLRNPPNYLLVVFLDKTRIVRSSLDLF
jgi:hypothetical protein